MKKTFVIQVEYPDCDFVSSEEIMEVTQECIENHLERYFGANIMDGEYSRIKVKKVTDGFTLVKRMREAQKDEAAFESELDRKYRGNTWFMSTEEMMERQELCNKVFDLTTEVDEWLKKMEV